MESSGDSDVVFNFYCTAGKLNRCRNLREPVTLSLDFCESAVVDYSPVVCCSFHWVFETTDCWCFWKMVLCRFGLFGTLRLGSADELFGC